MFPIVASSLTHGRGHAMPYLVGPREECILINLIVLMSKLAIDE